MERHKRYNKHNGDNANNIDSSCTLNNNSNYFHRCFSRFTFNSIFGNKRHVKRALKCDDGGVTSIEFLLYFVLFVFLIFSGFDYYLAETQLSVVQETNDYHMSRMRFSGTFNEAEAEMVRAHLMDNYNFSEVTITATGGGSPIMNAHYPETGVPVINYSGVAVVRNTVDQNSSELTLTIEAKPSKPPFSVGTLLGDTVDEAFTFRVSNRSLSELPSY